MGVQCKNTRGKVTVDIIKKEMQRALTFLPRLERLCVATTAERDASLQEQVRLLSQESQEHGNFSVDILFWDDIAEELAKDLDVLRKHYPQFSVDEGLRAHDRTQYNRICALLRSDGVIGFLRDTQMGHAFDRRLLDPLYRYRDACDDPEQEFVDQRLETVRKQLNEAISVYLAMVAVDTFPVDFDLSQQSVPREWKRTQLQRFIDTCRRLRRAADSVVAVHADLVRAGRN